MPELSRRQFAVGIVALVTAGHKTHHRPNHGPTSPPPPPPSPTGVAFRVGSSHVGGPDVVGGTIL